MIKLERMQAEEVFRMEGEKEELQSTQEMSLKQDSDINLFRK